jgi:hydroxymethylbilane synthase
MNRKKVTIGSRGSALALAQTRWVAEALKKAWPDLEIEMRKISTTGDRRDKVSFAQAGGKGIFTREIDLAQARGEIDLAVHSMKDVPTALSEGLVIAAVPERESPHDAAITRDGRSLEELSADAVVGTSSVRRRAWLKAWRPGLEVIEFRGNIDTRLRKLDGGLAEAIVLAAAGLARLKIARKHEELPFSLMLPAPGQGALAITARLDDQEAQELVAPLNHAPTFDAITLERDLLARLGGSCHIPFSAHAKSLGGKEMHLAAAVLDPDGAKILRSESTGLPCPELSNRVFEGLRAQGLSEMPGIRT